MPFYVVKDTRLECERYRFTMNFGTVLKHVEYQSVTSLIFCLQQKEYYLHIHKSVQTVFRTNHIA